MKSSFSLSVSRGSGVVRSGRIMEHAGVCHCADCRICGFHLARDEDYERK